MCSLPQTNIAKGFLCPRGHDRRTRAPYSCRVWPNQDTQAVICRITPSNARHLQLSTFARRNGISSNNRARLWWRALCRWNSDRAALLGLGWCLRNGVWVGVKQPGISGHKDLLRSPSSLESSWNYENSKKVKRWKLPRVRGLGAKRGPEAGHRYPAKVGGTGCHSPPSVNQLFPGFFKFFQCAETGPFSKPYSQGQRQPIFAFFVL